MKYFWCEFCYNRWEEEEPRKCPKCGCIEIRRTMSPEEAKEKGLLDQE
jgi:hypothetical protein